jgi:hypothetical protein
MGELHRDKVHCQQVSLEEIIFMIVACLGRLPLFYAFFQKYAQEKVSLIKKKL